MVYPGSPFRLTRSVEPLSAQDGLFSQRAQRAASRCTGHAAPSDGLRERADRGDQNGVRQRDPNTWSEGTTGPSWHLHHSVSFLTVPEKIYIYIYIYTWIPIGGDHGSDRGSGTPWESGAERGATMGSTRTAWKRRRAHGARGVTVTAMFSIGDVQEGKRVP